MMGLLQDLKFSARLLRNNPAFAATVVLTLAIAIAANTTTFSWIDGILLNPLPGCEDPSTLGSVIQVSSTGETMSSSHPDFRDFQRGATLASGIAAMHFTSFAIGDPQNVQHAWGQTVSANFFAVLGVKPFLGRLFLPSEDVDVDGAYPIAVISHRLWRTRFQSDRNIVGKSVRFNGRSLTIVGVTPPEFRGAFTGLMLDVWVPLSQIQKLGAIASWPVNSRSAMYLEVMVRLKRGVSIEQANAEFEAIGRRIAAVYPASHRGLSVRLIPFWQAQITGNMLIGPLRILMGVCLLVLLIACANVANLLLARSVSRSKEFGIRLALGGSQFRLVRQLLTEVLMLASAAAIIGLLISLWAGASLTSLLPPTEFPVLFEFDPNLRVLVFTLLLCALAAVASAIMPAVFSSRTNLNETLKEGGRSGGSGLRSHRARGLLVIGEVALASVALIGAALFARSFLKAQEVNPGFDPSHVLVSRFYLSPAGYSAEQEKQFLSRLRDRLVADPGIVDVSYADWVPLGFGDAPHQSVEIEGYAPRPTEDLSAPQVVVSPAYFRLLRIPMVAGREFTLSDTAKTARAIIVNQAFARRFFGSADPVGRKIKSMSWWFTVVGVAKDSKSHSLVEAPRPMLFLCFEQTFLTGWNSYLFVRTTGNPSQAKATLRREVMAIDPMAGLYDAMPLTDQTSAALYPLRVAATLLGVLGVLALFLAAVGLYSVMAYAVTERTQEIGIRMAMGAQSGDVLGLILRKGLSLTLAGLLAGVTVALLGARWVANMLIGVSVIDPLAIGATILFLAFVAFMASYLPARRATKINPMATLSSQ